MFVSYLRIELVKIAVNSNKNNAVHSVKYN